MAWKNPQTIALQNAATKQNACDHNSRTNCIMLLSWGIYNSASHFLTGKRHHHSLCLSVSLIEFQNKQNYPHWYEPCIIAMTHHVLSRIIVSVSKFQQQASGSNSGSLCNMEHQNSLAATKKERKQQQQQLCIIQAEDVIEDIETSLWCRNQVKHLHNKHKTTESQL